MCITTVLIFGTVERAAASLLCCAVASSCTVTCGDCRAYSPHNVPERERRMLVGGHRGCESRSVATPTLSRARPVWTASSVPRGQGRSACYMPRKLLKIKGVPLESNVRMKSPQVPVLPAVLDYTPMTSSINFCYKNLDKY